MTGSLCFHLNRLEYDANRANLARLLGRIEFDAYRTDLDSMQMQPGGSNNPPRIDEAQKKYAAHKDKYDKLRADVAIKLKFLEENKVRKCCIHILSIS